MNQPVAKQKPKPPPYPRPVRDLDIEELPPTHDDLAWDTNNGGAYYSDKNGRGQDEAELGGRAAKRRRIEACAQAYLRGEDVYIMSARLRGPFPPGWKNPWAKKSKQPWNSVAEPSRHIEIPETAKRIPSSVEEDKVSQLPVTTPGRHPASRSGLRGQPSTKPAHPEHALSPFTSRIQNLPSEPSPKVPQQAKEKRVQEWLRTSEGLPKSEILVHSSPTPVSRQYQGSRHGLKHEEISRASQSEPPRVRTPEHQAVGIVKSPRIQINDRYTGQERRVQQLSRNMQNMIAEPLAQSSTDLQGEVRKVAIPNTSSKAVIEAPRPEFAILKARNRTLQVVPADAHMSPFEFKRATTGKPEVTEQVVAVADGEPPSNALDNVESDLEGTNSRSKTLQSELPDKINDVVTKPNEELFATAPQTKVTNDLDSAQIGGDAQNTTTADSEMHEIVPVTNSLAPPVLSTIVSDISTADMLPSAQPRLEKLPSMSSITRDDKLSSIKQVPTISDKDEIFDGVGNDTSPVEQASSTAELKHTGEVELNEDKHTLSKEGLNGVARTLTPVPVHNMVELNTQEMLAGIEPLELSTIKKPQLSASRGSPVTATKNTSDNKRKKASFALNASSMSSHNSIRESMKAKVSKNVGSPPSFLLGKNNLDVEVSDEENSIPQKRLKSHDSPVKAKGILKRTNPSFSPNTQRKTKSSFLTGLDSDGQTGSMLPLASGQNGVEEDKFDLDAAIDDLGSFLGTWDAEREASSLEIEL